MARKIIKDRVSVKTKKKTDLDALTEENFEELLKNVNQKIYGLLQDAQNKANELLSRFNLKVSVTADYACSNSENEPE